MVLINTLQKSFLARKLIKKEFKIGPLRHLEYKKRSDGKFCKTQIGILLEFEAWPLRWNEGCKHYKR